jgi:hypothetical protein
LGLAAVESRVLPGLILGTNPESAYAVAGSALRRASARSSGSVSAR